MTLTATQQNLPRDTEGFPYLHAHGMDFRVTECCGCPSTFTGDGAHVCKGCYEEVDYSYGDLPAHVEPPAFLKGHRGPVRITLPPQ